MPGNVRTAAQEKYWKRAKKHVEDSRGYGEGSFTDQDWGLVQTIYQRIKAKYESKLETKTHSKQVNSSSVVEAKTRRKRQRCDCLYGTCGNCYYGWAFAPYYGKGDRKSPAAISTLPSDLPSDVPSGANPGPGGINMPGIPNGPNSGMGPSAPVTASRWFDPRSIFDEAKNLWKLAEEKS